MEQFCCNNKINNLFTAFNEHDNMEIMTSRSDGVNLDVYGNTEQDVVDVEGVINAASEKEK